MFGGKGWSQQVKHKCKSQMWRDQVFGGRPPSAFLYLTMLSFHSKPSRDVRMFKKSEHGILFSILICLDCMYSKNLQMSGEHRKLCPHGNRDSHRIWYANLLLNDKTHFYFETKLCFSVPLLCSSRLTQKCHSWKLPCIVYLWQISLLQKCSPPEVAGSSINLALLCNIKEINLLFWRNARHRFLQIMLVTNASRRGNKESSAPLTQNRLSLSECNKSHLRHYIVGSTDISDC